MTVLIVNSLVGRETPDISRKDQLCSLRYLVSEEYEEDGEFNVHPVYMYVCVRQKEIGMKFLSIFLLILFSETS